MSKSKRVFETKININTDTGKLEAIIRATPEFRRLMRIASKTKSWKSEARILNRILKALGVSGVDH